jgi:YkoY family integral membrane protein
MNVEAADFLTIALLVVLEGLLSADNALVLAIIVLGLPKKDQRKALRYGILGAFFFRIVAILLAVHLIQFGWVKVVGAGYLLYLAYDHFLGRRSGGESRSAIKPATGWLGLSPFWGTVAKVELTDIVFAVDSILVAVAMSPKQWVIITGGVLGIIAMRMVIGQLLRVVRRYPALVDGAFVIIAWVAIKLLIEYLSSEGYVDFHISKWVSFGVIAVIFTIAYVYARRQGAVPDDEEDAATALIEKAENELGNPNVTK